VARQFESPSLRRSVLDVLYSPQMCAKSARVRGFTATKASWRIANCGYRSEFGRTSLRWPSKSALRRILRHQVARIRRPYDVRLARRIDRDIQTPVGIGPVARSDQSGFLVYLLGLGTRNVRQVSWAARRIKTELPVIGRLQRRRQSRGS
jgi:hypothetical protein